MEDFGSIYEQYFNYVFRYLLSLTRNESLAEELTEEAFFKALIALDSFRSQSQIKVWLCQIAKNTYFSYLRKQRTADMYIQIAEVLESPDFEQSLIDRDDTYRAIQQMNALEEPGREVFRLRVIGELSFKEIAAIFQKNEHWACVTYHRAKDKIKKGMNNDEKGMSVD